MKQGWAELREGKWQGKATITRGRSSSEMVTTETKQDQYGMHTGIQLVVAAATLLQSPPPHNAFPPLFHDDQRLTLLTANSRSTIIFRSFHLSRGPMSTSNAATSASGEVAADTQAFSVLPRARYPLWQFRAGSGEVQYQNGPARVLLHL